MKVLIGGGTGFVGRHLEKALRQRGHTVQLISRSKGKNKNSNNSFAMDFSEFIHLP